MAYVGRRPLIGDFFTLDAISPSATTTFNLLKSGSAYAPQTAANCIVSVNGVTQAPNTSYTISGTTIVFSTALATTDTIDYILVLGDVLNVGTPSAGTVNAASFASGFNGVVTWQNVQTTNFTAVAGRGYPVNTTSAGITMTLPASATTGATIQVVDYAGTFGTNNLTVNPNGLNFNGSTSNATISQKNEGLQLTYVDATQGWKQILASNEGQAVPYTASYLIVAGGGAGGYGGGGGGGAGGLLTSTTNLTPGTVYTITVGGGGTAAGATVSGSGTNSSITGLTAAVGGAGAGNGANSISGTSNNGASGGSGGGGGGYDGAVTRTGGSGTSGQGNAGGSGNPNGTYYGAGGGGGSGGAGGNGTSSAGGTSGSGTASSITGSSVTYAAGGTGSGASGGTGSAGTTNTGNGGNGGSNGSFYGGNGGSGVVILSVPTANYSATVTGTYSTGTSGSNTWIKWTASGTYTG